MAPILSFIVLRTAQTERLLEFYCALGFEFVEEQHGNGPRHFAAQNGSFVLEIFPGEAGMAPDRKSGGATMLGLQIENLTDVLHQLSLLRLEPLTPPRPSQWGLRAVVCDPDGRAVELNQPL